jgi:hypothetical protein
MSTGVIIGIAVCAALLVGLIVVLNRAGRKRQVETRREQAHGLRQDAQARQLHATRQQAEADEQSARAKQAAAEAEEKAAIARREEAEANERAQSADRERRFARERHEQARSIDPDVTDEAEQRSQADESQQHPQATAGRHA